jgi:hypothetical protein
LGLANEPDRFVGEDHGEEWYPPAEQVELRFGTVVMGHPRLQVQLALKLLTIRQTHPDV